MSAEAKQAGRTNTDLRKLNLSYVLSQVHYENSTTRSEIATATGLNRSTVLTLLDSLEKRGLVIQGSKSDHSDIGRPSMTVNASQSVVSFAVLPRLNELNLGVVGFDGSIITQARLPLKTGTTPETASLLAAEWIEKIRKTLPKETLISGVGVAAAGPINASSGEIRLSPSLGWSETAFKELLSETIQLPVAIDNDAGLWCAAEQQFGVGRGHQHMLLLIGVNGGLGGGAVVNGQLVRGQDGYAGEFGHMRISDKTQKDYSGIPGTLEAMVKREDIIKTLGAGSISDAQLFEMVEKSKSKKLESLLSEQTEYLGRAIGVLLNAFNPEILVLAGFLELFVNLRKEQLVKEISSQSLPFAAENLKIVRGTRGNDLLMVGTAELGFDGLTRDPLKYPLTKA